jgi:hypothetical protein
MVSAIPAAAFLRCTWAYCESRDDQTKEDRNDALLFCCFVVPDQTLSFLLGGKAAGTFRHLLRPADLPKDREGSHAVTVLKQGKFPKDNAGSSRLGRKGKVDSASARPIEVSSLLIAGMVKTQRDYLPS